MKAITSDGTTPIPASNVFKFTIQSDGDGGCSPIYSLGDIGPAGGTVGILPTTTGNTTGLYFEFGAASPSQEYWCPFSSPGSTTTVGTRTAIGTGSANTVKIVAKCASGAAVYADNYSLGGYSDWFLPSSLELYEARNYLPAGRYWLSSEESSVEAYNQAFPTTVSAFHNFWGKHWLTNYVLPMRTFTN